MPLIDRRQLFVSLERIDSEIGRCVIFVPLWCPWETGNRAVRGPQTCASTALVRRVYLTDNHVSTQHMYLPSADWDQCV